MQSGKRGPEKDFGRAALVVIIKARLRHQVCNRLQEA